LQCGFCTPGFLMATYALLKEHPNLHLTGRDSRGYCGQFVPLHGLSGHCGGGTPGGQGYEKVVQRGLGIWRAWGGEPAQAGLVAERL
jgi:hypothetical protein